MSDYREFQDGEVVPGTRYRVKRLIGAGGMGRVYEVEHVELGKRFVLKALQRELSRREDLVARLRNEWRALARLEHPNIVNVTDAGTSENGVPFYVMERLEGETLSALLHRQRRLTPPQALAISAAILEGLHAAHQIGVVHRDVKPPNIFLTAQGTVKILDFGIAKIKDAKDVITARGLAVGTPRYMSPEQAQGTAVDARSDIYATGLMLFEMVSGVGPFDDAHDHNQLLLAHLGRKAPLLSSISVVAPELDAMVAGMLAKDPRERPPNARQVAETLRALGQRYVHRAGTEAPTVEAAPRAPLSEPPTRVEGQRRPSQPAPATRPDGIAAHGSAAGDTTTVQPAFEIATTAAHPLPKSNVTQRLPHAPLATPSFYGPDTLVDPLTKVPSGEQASVERTEMLSAVPPPPGIRPHTDPGPTRTAVPLAEAPNLTPPPVVPSRASLLPQPSRPGLGRGVAAALVAVLLLAGGVVALRRARSSDTPIQVAPAAAPLLSPGSNIMPPVTEPPASAVALPPPTLGSEEQAAPPATPAVSVTPVADTPVAESKPERPSETPLTIRNGSRKRAVSAPHSAAAAAGGSLSAAPAAPLPKPAAAMPGSGL